MEKRRKELYRLHRKYQQRTGVAPDANAPPSGIIPPPTVEEEFEGVSTDGEDESGEDDELSPEFGGRIPRAVRRPGESAVVGWAAEGIAAGAIDGTAVVSLYVRFFSVVQFSQFWLLWLVPVLRIAVEYRVSGPLQGRCVGAEKNSLVDRSLAACRFMKSLVPVLN